MSSDLLEEIKDKNGTSVLLEMNVSNLAWIAFFHRENEKYRPFFLSPDNNGIDNAEKIAKALLAWREHVIATSSLVK